MFDFPTFTFDVEVYPNFSLAGFRDYATGQVTQYSNHPAIGHSFADLRQWFTANAAETLFIGFNSLAYDNQILRAVIIEQIDDPATLFERSVALIQASSRFANRLESIDQEVSADLLAIAGGQKAKLGSLKECGIKSDFYRLQVLPLPFDQALSVDEMRVVATYNALDLEITARVAGTMRDAIMARIALSIQYGVRVINRHDAGLAEKVMAAQLFGAGKPEWPTATAWSIRGRDLTQQFAFQNPALQDLVGRIADWHMRFTITEHIDNGETIRLVEGPSFADAFQVDGVTYRMGVGGLHSDDAPGIFETDDTFRLIDFDVASFYPALIINHQCAPVHLNKRRFLIAFDTLRQARLQAKATGQQALANGLKVAVNSIFGKTKSAYSWLCDPVMNVSITVLGQLSLLTFVDVIAGIADTEVISANTDGLTLRIRRANAAAVITAMHKTAATMGLMLDETEYTKLVRRDINNYIAACPGKPAKAKGAYGYDPANLSKKATNRVVIDAVQRFLIDGIPLAETIRGCREIPKFVDYFKGSKGYQIVDDQGASHGKIARWYLAVDGRHLDKIKLADGKRTQLVERGAMVINDLPNAFPDDVDYLQYERMAEKLVTAITEPPEPSPSTIPHAELSSAQGAVLTALQTATEPNLALCQLIDLSRYHADYAAVIKGNKHDTIKALLVRLWLGHCGRLSVADLEWLGHALDESVGHFRSRPQNLRKMCEWIGWEISPFPLPRSPAEHIERALEWAKQTVQPAKRRRTMRHDNIFASTYSTGEAMRAYDKSRNILKLACSIAAASVKYDETPDPILLVNILEQVLQHFSGQRIAA